jgi:predicted AAA+ superfamily ATPase
LTAQEINYSQLGRDIGLSPKTSHAWLDIMRGTYQWIEVPPYHSNTLKRISGKAKGYFGDTGLACSAQSVSSPSALASSPFAGALFETWVVNEIRKQSSLLAFPANMYHWRSHGGGEVDLILERDGVLYPIEIKMKTQPSRSDSLGISAFRKTYPDANIAMGAVICCCSRAYKISENVYAVPWNQK